MDGRLCLIAREKTMDEGKVKTIRTVREHPGSRAGAIPHATSKAVLLVDAKNLDR
jgi:hypothetical protein